MRLNLGSSDDLHPDFLNVDIWEPPGATPDNFLKADLRKKWPWEDSTIEEIRAHDILEHLPDIRKSMNEAHRVLVPGGILDLFVPTTDGRGAFQDPTHVSFWNANTMYYFVEDFAEWMRFHEAYGISARFRIAGPGDAISALARAQQEYPGKVTKMMIRLEAVK